MNYRNYIVIALFVSVNAIVCSDANLPYDLFRYPPTKKIQQPAWTIRVKKAAKKQFQDIGSFPTVTIDNVPKEWYGLFIQLTNAAQDADQKKLYNLLTTPNKAVNSTARPLINVQANWNNWFTPLHYAIDSRKPANVELLLKYGADPDAIGQGKIEPNGVIMNLMSPREFSHLLQKQDPSLAPITQLLEEYHLKKPMGQMIRAIQQGDSKQAQHLLETGMRKSINNRIYWAKDELLLNLAIVHNRKDIVSLMLANGANPDLRMYTDFFDEKGKRIIKSSLDIARDRAAQSNDWSMACEMERFSQVERQERGTRIQSCRLPVAEADKRSRTQKYNTITLPIMQPIAEEIEQSPFEEHMRETKSTAPQIAPLSGPSSAYEEQLSQSASELSIKEKKSSGE